MASTQFGSVTERTVLKEGQLFVVADRDGDIKALNLEGQGLYYRDRRHLSLFEMAVNGTRLTLLSSAGELNFLSNLQFTNDLLLGPDGRVLAEPRTISINRQRFVSSSVHERVHLLNYNPHPITLIVRFTCGSDFRDMFDVRGFSLDGDAGTDEIEPIQVKTDRIVLGYRSRTGARRRTHVVFDPPPEHIEIVNPRLKRRSRAEAPGLSLDQRDEGTVVPPIAAAQFAIELPPNVPCSIDVNVTPETDEDAGPTPATGVRVLTQETLDAASEAVRASYDEWQSKSTRIETDNELFDQILHRAVLDVRLLVESFDGDLVPAAGIPWFAVPFGRDSLIVSMQTLSLQPHIARGTLRFLARFQGKHVNAQRGEAPGKILHEVRPGVTGSMQDSIFYGSIDSTPLFLVALGEYLSWTGDLALARELLPNAEAALEWMAAYGDPDGSGFLTCNRYPNYGLGDQGWKDSPDSMNHADGSPAEQPVALAEVQAYAFAAHRAMARIYRCFGDSENERAQRAAGERLRAQFLERFRIEDSAGPYWAMGIDARGRPIETVTTNPGHALWAGLLPDSAAAVTARRLVADDLLCGWGIRTLSARAPTYNPMSYHNGSVWPHDNALVALGMKRSGADEPAGRVATQIFEAGLLFPGARFPELWCGFPRDPRHSSAPAQYPVGCSPQGWAAGSAFMLLQALLGLEADALTGVVRLRPTLPEWLSQVSYRGLRVGATEVDFDVFREGHRLRVEMLEAGALKVEVREAVEVD
ncbi:MAG: amylo-alpha-1,6-glucosidase [Chloroflexi bacterium]|nr:amylo-alpha-1,6-glucosidase [Chloroflexota bacterium]